MKKAFSPRQVFERQISEEDVIGQIRTILELNRIVVHRIVERIPWGSGKSSRRSEPGIPDLMIVIPSDRVSMYFSYPRVAFIEVKRPGGARRPAQVAWINQAQRDGLCAFFAESCEDVAKNLSEIGVEIRGLEWSIWSQ